MSLFLTIYTLSHLIKVSCLLDVCRLILSYIDIVTPSRLSLSRTVKEESGADPEILHG